MKKFILLFLLMTPLAWPTYMLADDYEVTEIPPDYDGDEPHKAPARFRIYADVNAETGVLALYFSYAINDLHLTIAQNGAILDEATFTVAQGQTVTYDLSGYTEGTYRLTLETADGVIKQYIVTIED